MFGDWCEIVLGVATTSTPSQGVSKIRSITLGGTMGRVERVGIGGVGVWLEASCLRFESVLGPLGVKPHGQAHESAEAKKQGWCFGLVSLLDGSLVGPSGAERAEMDAVRKGYFGASRGMAASWVVVDGQGEGGWVEPILGWDWSGSCVAQ